MTDAILARIKEQNAALGWSETDLARASGVHQQTVNRILSGETKMSKHLPTLISTLERELQLKENKIHLSFDTPDGALGVDSLLGLQDLRIFSSAQAGPGRFIVSTEPSDYVQRPHRLLGVTEAYGILVDGHCMEPAYWHNDIVYVNPAVAPAAQTDVLLYRGDKFEAREALFKRLVRISPTHWHVLQWNPPEGEEKEFALCRKEYGVCHRVIGRVEK